MQLELIPPGLCQCGCGETTPVAPRNRRGYRKGEPLRYLQGHNSRIAPTRKTRFPVLNGKKRCADCGEEKPVSAFHVKREQDRERLGNLCGDCQSEYKRWRHLGHRWGFHRDEWERRFNEQGRVCAICGTDSVSRGWHVDHDHSCCSGWRCCGKCVRGILCHRCNTGLGMFGDSPEKLRTAYRYLEAALKE